jgi:homoserine dehydrogenase
MSDHRTLVLKFGSSVIPDENAMHGAVHEIYRHVRQGRRVVAVVSAFGSTTDDLIQHAKSITQSPSDDALAAFLATGEQRAGALLTLALERAGIPARVADPGAIGLLAKGSSLDASAVSLDAAATHKLLDECPVLVVPGFYGRREDWSIALLGRGGSDLTALFIAGRLGADCVLLKDVDGLYERDPAEDRTAPRFTSVSYDRLLQLPEGVVQHKAVRYAKDQNLRFSVAACGNAHHTTVGPGEIASGAPIAKRPPLRVALLGLGTVGLGVYQHLLRQSNRFEVIGIAVRDAKRHIDAGIPSWLIRDDPAALATDPRADIVVELIGGPEPARSLMAQALAAGKHVVTGNKRVLAEDDGSLQALAQKHGGSLRFSAAVGGAVPMVELVGVGASRGTIRSVRGIVNGTTNFILSRIESGDTFDAALAEAQRLGYAEADPSADVDGHDAAQKIALLAAAAFGKRVPVSEVATSGIRTINADAVRATLARGQRTRLVAQALRENGQIRVSVSPQTIESSDPLYHTVGTQNRVVVTLDDGSVLTAHGLGAGRGPTSEAVAADLLDIWRHASASPTASH